MYKFRCGRSGRWLEAGRLVYVLACLGLAALVSLPTWADETPAASAADVSRYAPQDVRFVLKNKGFMGADLKLQGMYYTPPKGNAPYPLVIFSHGSNADVAARRKFSPRSYWGPARYFLNRGFAVLYFLRPSYGESEGPYLEANNSCENASYGPGFESLADTVMAARDYALTLPSIDAKRIIFAGHSAGGAASIAAAARQPPGVMAYINFAGGKGGSEATPYKPCSAQEVNNLFANYAKTTSLPALWVYAPNDLYFGGDVMQSWHKATTEAGGKARLFVTSPAKADQDGHHIVQKEMLLWIPTVDIFLKSLGFEWSN